MIPRAPVYAFARDGEIHIVNTSKGFWKLTPDEARRLIEDLVKAVDGRLYTYAQQNEIMRQAERV